MRGFFEESLKRFCDRKFGRDSWVDGSYKDDMTAKTVEFTILAKGFAQDAPKVSLESIEELSLELGTSHIMLQPIDQTVKNDAIGLVHRPGIRFSATQVTFIFPG